MDGSQQTPRTMIEAKGLSKYFLPNKGRAPMSKTGVSRTLLRLGEGAAQVA